MFDHVGIRVSDREASERFYNTVLSTLGIEQTHKGPETVEWDEFCIGDDGPVTRRLHIGFRATGVPPRRHRGRHHDNRGPGERPVYYGAFVLDPDGNDVESSTTTGSVFAVALSRRY